MTTYADQVSGGLALAEAAAGGMFDPWDKQAVLAAIARVHYAWDSDWVDMGPHSAGSCQDWGSGQGAWSRWQFSRWCDTWRLHVDGALAELQEVLADLGANGEAEVVESIRDQAATVSREGETTLDFGTPGDWFTRAPLWLKAGAVLAAVVLVRAAVDGRPGSLIVKAAVK